MNMNGIGNSTASWAQFVKLTQAARDRNGGLGGGAALSDKPSSTQPNVAAASIKRGAGVYSSSINKSASAQNAQAAALIQNESLTRKTAGGLFDAYA